MKIYSMEVQTVVGRRVVQLAAPLLVDPVGTMPPNFGSLTQMLWEVLCGTVEHAPLFAAAAPKVEA